MREMMLYFTTMCSNMLGQVIYKFRDSHCTYMTMMADVSRLRGLTGWQEMSFGYVTLPTRDVADHTQITTDITTAYSLHSCPLFTTSSFHCHIKT